MKRLAIPLLLCLATCAGGAPYDAKTVPPLSKGESRIVLMREFSVPGSLNSAVINIDGKTVANLWGDSFCVVNLKPGLHEITWDRILFPNVIFPIPTLIEGC